MSLPIGCGDMTQHGVTEALASYCATAAAEPLPPDVRDRLKRHLLDFVGLTLGANEHAVSSQPLLDAMETLAGGYEGGEATVLPTGERQAAEHAALLNGSFAHSLDFDDTHRESSLHPGAVVVPAALAVAEREEADTDRLLAAIDVGYDITCAVGRAVNPDAHYDRGFHITATCGTFGATAAAGIVAGLDESEFENAFGVNGSQAAGSLQFLANGAWNTRLHPGLAARRGVLAVALAENGFEGATEPLEGKRGFFNGYTDEPHMDGFDHVGEHAVLETSLKPYPCCRYMHAALDGLLDLTDEVDPDEVESVVVDLPRAGVTLTGEPIETKRRPSNLVDCQFSMPFGVALALTEGDAGLDAFLDAQSRLDEPRFHHLLDATEVVTTDTVQSVFPERWAARVVVQANDEHERFVDAATGDPESPLGWDGVTEKFVELATGTGATRETADTIADTVRNLDERSVDDLVTATRTASMDGQPAQ